MNHLVTYSSNDPIEILCVGCERPFVGDGRKRVLQITLNAERTEIQAVRQVHEEPCYKRMLDENHQRILSRILLPARNRSRERSIESDHKSLFEFAMNQYDKEEDGVLVTIRPAMTLTDANCPMYELSLPSDRKVKIKKEFYGLAQFCQLFTQVVSFKLSVCSSKDDLSVSTFYSALGMKLRQLSNQSMSVRVWTYVENASERQFTASVVLTIEPTETRLMPLFQSYRADDSIKWGDLMVGLGAFAALPQASKRWESASLELRNEVDSMRRMVLNAISSPSLDGVTAALVEKEHTSHLARMELHYVDQSSKNFVLSQACQTSMSESTPIYFLPLKPSDPLIVATGKTADPIPCVYSDANKLEQEIQAAGLRKHTLSYSKYFQTIATNKPKAC